MSDDIPGGRPPRLGRPWLAWAGVVLVVAIIVIGVWGEEWFQ